MPRAGTPPVHTHESNAQGGQLDIDNALSDIVHLHSAAAEGGQLDWDQIFSDAIHSHESNAEGGQLSHDAALTGVSADDHHNQSHDDDDHAGTVRLSKAANETVNNSTTLQNDDDILFSIGANEVWIFHMIFRGALKAASDLKMDWSLPSGASKAWQYTAWRSGVGWADGEQGTGQFAVLVSVNDNYIIRASGKLTNGATAGTAQFQWAQNTAAVEDTILVGTQFIFLAHRLA